MRSNALRWSAPHPLPSIKWELTLPFAVHWGLLSNA